MSEERQEAPEVKPQAEHVSLKIAGQGFPDLMIKVKKTTKLQKMMAAYCERAGKSLSELRGDQTVASLDIDDEDEVLIEVASEAVGAQSEHHQRAS
ncbi:BZ3500_MvSof-1268-A1-R1_Chr4-1g06691 [Microbotryum saponariae]|uniref:BZ3500_MvSof-1268-A1-R1_Chr4-1g06691 protein n=1 Tax=Microbotryum saponariae TaxID=289078 RepID=A0A2X0NK87_9BASI|nr:BZ3500_MvSof-1268-A1-R1_Chr4-1g06691 [Microbotryum saponariae]SDA06356.1 BZ3501_MvSof-1269-A2-R1_Chr4-1g06401 [Microbotryum saponariae]